MVRAFDYLVVGGGTAGSVLASRLSEDPDSTVLLLEAGAAAGPATLSDPAAWPSLWPGAADWGYSTSSQTGLSGSALLFPRGKVLGGSSGINGMIHVRGHRANFTTWEALGAKGWGHGDLLPFFKRSETVPGSDPDRGDSGPMRPAPAPPDSAFSRSVLAAMHEHPRVVAASFHDLNIVDGRRQSAADAYLTPPVRRRPNLTIWTRALVHRVLLEGGRAAGVVVAVDGELRTARASNEVVLAAGTVGTPHLLMLSGIGPAQHLRDHGIHVAVDLPGVGGNLQDHPLAPVVYAEAAQPTTSAYQYAEVSAQLNTDPAVAEPDVQLLLVSRGFNGHNLPGPLAGSLVGVALLTPHSRGHVRLAGPDVAGAPVIDPCYLSDDRDVDRLVEGVEATREIMNDTTLIPWRGPELLPGEALSDARGLRAYLHLATGSYWHPVGTARLGQDPESVVDLELRVHDVPGLRVGDASVMPTIVSANTNATVLAVAERAAHLITRS